MQSTAANEVRFRAGTQGKASTLSRTTITLHWLVAASIIGLGVLGKVMEVNEHFSLYPFHKSLGILALITVIARVIWRVKQGWPKPVSEYQAWEQRLYTITQTLLLTGTALMSLSGMTASGVSGYGFGIFSLNILPANYTPEGAAISYSPFWESIAYGLHRYIGYTLAALIGLHILGALKHHLINKDHTLKRMLGRSS